MDVDALVSQRPTENKVKDFKELTNSSEALATVIKVFTKVLSAMPKWNRISYAGYFLINLILQNTFDVSLKQKRLQKLWTKPKVLL